MTIPRTPKGLSTKPITESARNSADSSRLARQQKLPYQDFIELVLADEAARRDRIGGDVRARAARLDMSMRLEAWDESTKVSFDRQLWNELCSLRFCEEAASVLILGPVGVGKTMLANCLGHIASRRRRSVLFGRADHILKRLKASRLDGTYEQELRRLLRVDLLILDDFCLQAMDTIETHDLYEIVVERHRRASMVLTSNREPKEWPAMMADPMLAQSAVDRIVNSAYELVLEGDSYRPRQRPQRVQPMNETDFIPMRDVWRDDSDALQARRCPVCDSQLSSTRARYCSSACRNRAWRRRRDQIVFRSDTNLPGQPSWQAIYERPHCKRRLLGDHRCPDCNLFGSRLGLGGRCPHCGEPVLLTDLASAPATP